MSVNPPTGDGSGGGGDGLSEAFKSDLRKLYNALTDPKVASITIGGTTYALLDNPQAFIMAVVIDYFLEGAIQLAGETAAVIALAYGTVADALTMTITEVTGSFGHVGDGLLDAVRALNETLVSVATTGGPAAPFLVLILWGAIGLAVAIAIRTLLEAIQWI